MSERLLEAVDVYRKVCELDTLGALAIYRDPTAYAALHPSKIRTIRDNPFLTSENECGQLLGVVGETIIGGVCPLPLEVVADGRVYSAMCGSSLAVMKEFRCSGYGMDVLDKYRAISKDKIDINSGLSEDSERLCKLLGKAVFPFYRRVLIRRVGHFTSYRKPILLWRGLTPFLNGLFFLHRACIKGILAGRFRGYRIREIHPEDHQMLEMCVGLVSADPHRFRQNVTIEWLRWVLKNEFRPVEKANKRLFGVTKNGRLVAFWLSKTDSGGEVGRIIEWQVAEGYEWMEHLILLKAGIELLKVADVVTIDLDSEATYGILSRYLLPSMKGQTCVVDADESSPLQNHKGFKERKNWRIRPGWGDAAFY